MFQRWMQVLGFMLLLLLMATQEVLAQSADNQQKLDEARTQVVNPLPIDRSFQLNNSKHKILLAVIDTGVDYNHPGLKNNVHFSLDSAGRPVGAGWDYTGNDGWPAPYVTPSVDRDEEAPDQARVMTLGMIENYDAFAKAYPKHADKINSSRHLIQEVVGGLFHGTHVAGLAVYDLPEVGLLPYRTIPFNIVFKAGRASMPQGPELIVQAIQRAIRDGARVINMSLGISVTKDLEKESPKLYLDLLKQIAEIKAIALANPQVAFVAATGNDGTWIDERARQALPCGVEAKNILCVGALDTAGEIASFSNIVLPDFPFLLAPGQEIVSFSPVQMCNLPEMILQGFAQQFNPARQSMQEFFFKSVAQYCDTSSGFQMTSGTSMASPLAARLVAKELLKNSGLTGAQAIQNVLSAGTDVKVGRLTIRRVKVDRPSWYPESRTLVSAGADRPFFEFLTK